MSTATKRTWPELDPVEDGVSFKEQEVLNIPVRRQLSRKGASPRTSQKYQKSGCRAHLHIFDISNEFGGVGITKCQLAGSE
jgi:hypothetical protein